MAVAPSEPSDSTPHVRSAFRTILVAWLVAGTLDILVAVTYYPLTAHVSVERLLQGIASGLLGMQAFAGGVATAALGLLCHYSIALIWTLFFFVVFPRMKILARSLVPTGLAYGLFVGLVMNVVVVPLSRTPKGPFNLTHFLIAVFILLFTIGLPLAEIIGRYYSAVGA